MSTRTATVKSCSACETKYVVMHEGMEFNVDLWIITGGTPCLSFHVTPFSKRYPIVERWTNDHWQGCIGHYDHQEGQNPVIGPKVEEVLPNGWADFWEYFDANYMKVIISERRRLVLREILPINQTVLDKSEHCQLTAQLECWVNYFHIPPVTYNSRWGFGRMDDKVVLFDPWWKEASEILNPMFDTGHLYWCDLSEDKFQEIVEFLKKGKAKFSKKEKQGKRLVIETI